MDQVKKLAEEVIKDDNYSYGVKTELSRENFPEKSYGKITLPQGNYEAFRIIIGTGQGKNWWCVMFPPLCFVDEAKAEVEYDKTEKRINSQKDAFDFSINSNGEDYKSNSDEEKIDKEDNNKKQDHNKAIVEKQTTDKEKSDKIDAEDKEKVQIKFKLVELIKKLFN
jgi:Stage II sporulation protein R (spore_II_R).